MPRVRCCISAVSNMAATQADQFPRGARPLNANFSFNTSVSEAGANGSRRGNVHFPGRKTIQTPHYLALSSRGIVSHLSQDMMREHTSVTGLYTALEDLRYRESSIPSSSYIRHTGTSPWLSASTIYITPARYITCFRTTS